jgi:hypothetical protein
VTEVVISWNGDNGMLDALSWYLRTTSQNSPFEDFAEAVKILDTYRNCPCREQASKPARTYPM